MLVALVLSGAAACAGAAAMTWWTADYDDSLTGPLTVAATGADCMPELVPVALVALAGLGAMLAARGAFRRLVGVVLMVGGLLVAVRAVLVMTQAPAALTAALTRPAEPVGAAQLHPFGPILAIVGGVLVTAAGAFGIAGVAARRRLGSRYDAPAARRAAAAPRAAAESESDWWKAMDAGADPTDLTDPTVSDGPRGGGYHDPSDRAT